MGQKLKLDFSGVESFQRAAEGIHTVKIATAEVKQSSGGNDMITIAFEVTKGADKGARVFENFPLVDKALWKLKGLLQSIGMKADGKMQLDVDKLVGKVCNINVIHEEYEGKLRARVESIMKFDAGEVDNDDDDEFEEETPEEDVEEEAVEEKPKKSKKAPMNKPDPVEEDDDDWDDDEEEEEEPEEKPAKKEKAAKKEEKKPAKKSKKGSEDEDDDWDDEDWDEA